MIDRPPAWAGTQRVLLRGGNVYSPADPFATAMLVVGHEVGWIGGDGAALAMADGVDEVVELDGALVAPAFVDADGAAAAPGVALVLGSGPGPLVAPRAERVVTGELSREEISRLAGLGAVVVVRPRDDDPPPLASLAAAGVPLAFGSGGRDGSPWQTVAAAVNHPDPDQRISARAAFAAHTRGGWRAAGLPSVGALVPGAPAHYAVWEAAELVVQAPDERIQAWSTDPRSGTPGLPDLSPGVELPRCLRTVVWGRVV